MGLPVEAGIVAALIGFAAALLGQFVAVFLGARYAAELNRKTQLEIAALSFQRQWRERLLHPHLELASQRLSTVIEFNNAVMHSDLEGALKAARSFSGTEPTVQTAALERLGDQQLSTVSQDWFRASDELAHTFDVILTNNGIRTEDRDSVARGLIDLVEATGRLYAEAGQYAAGRNGIEPSHSRALWKKLSRTPRATE